MTLMRVYEDDNDDDEDCANAASEDKRSEYMC